MEIDPNSMNCGEDCTKRRPQKPAKKRRTILGLNRNCLNEQPSFDGNDSNSSLLSPSAWLPQQPTSQPKNSTENFLASGHHSWTKMTTETSFSSLHASFSSLPSLECSSSSSFRGIPAYISDIPPIPSLKDARMPPAAVEGDDSSRGSLASRATLPSTPSMRSLLARRHRSQARRDEG